MLPELCAIKGLFLRGWLLREPAHPGKYEAAIAGMSARTSGAPASLKRNSGVARRSGRARLVTPKGVLIGERARERADPPTTQRTEHRCRAGFSSDPRSGLLGSACSSGGPFSWPASHNARRGRVSARAAPRSCTDAARRWAGRITYVKRHTPPYSGPTLSNRAPDRKTPLPPNPETWAHGAFRSVRRNRGPLKWTGHTRMGACYAQS